MTPSYASPEQIQSKSVTTATDIYSLGVILYEILSGHRPFETKEQDLKEIYQAIIEDNPPLPSSVVEAVSKKFKEITEAKTVVQFQELAESVVGKKSKSQTAGKLSDTKENKVSQTKPQTINLSSGSIRGDLDNIILKALRKEPERRYSSAENFAEDIKRHLRGLPVNARPNTFSYRAEKFVKRNKASVVAGFVILLVIIGGVGATFWQARVAQAERDRAVSENQKAEKINMFLQNILNLSNPLWFSDNPDSNRTATIAQAIDEAAKNVETELAGQPAIQAEIQLTLGKTYLGQGQYQKGREQLEKSKQNFLRSSPDDLSKVMQISSVLGALLVLEGGEDSGEKMLVEAVAYFRANLDKNKENRKWLVTSLDDLGLTLMRKGETAKAEELVRESMKYGAELTGQDRWAYVASFGDLGDILVEKGKTDEAIAAYRKSIAEAAELTDKPRADQAHDYYDLGRVYKNLGDLDEARKNLQKAYEIQKETLGDGNLYTVMTRKQVAEIYYLQGDYAAARTEIDEVWQTLQDLNLEKNNLYENYVREVQANILTKTGESAKAEKIMREIIKIYQGILKSPNIDIAIAKRSLGETLLAQKKNGEAKTVLTDADKEFTATVGEDNIQTTKCRELLKSAGS